MDNRLTWQGFHMLRVKGGNSTVKIYLYRMGQGKATLRTINSIKVVLQAYLQ